MKIKEQKYILPDGREITIRSAGPEDAMKVKLEKSLNDYPEIAARVEQYNPLPPHGSGPEDVAYGVLYLASDESACVTGSELVIDCGHLLI